MKARQTGIALLAAGCLVLAGLAQAQDKGKPGAAAPKSSAQDQAMMEKMMQLAQPGPEHQKLAKLVGKWTTTSTMTDMDPSAPPVKSTGTAEFETLLGGRYLMQKAKGDMAGMPFEGMGIMGYDKGQQKYISYWIDNFGTMMLTGNGSADSTGKVITITSLYDDPMTGVKNSTMRQVLKMVSDDELHFELFSGAQGKEQKIMDMVYKRVK